MSLFIESLAKKIIEYMNYRDSEILSLKKELSIIKTQMDKGYISCGHINARFDLQDDLECHNCSLTVCKGCLDDTWVFTKYTNEGAKVLNSKDVNKKNLDVFYEMTEHHMFCSKECFKKYYGDYPIINKCYTVIRIQ